MKTLAELKREAAAGNMILTLTERFGGSDESHIPERMAGGRKVIGMNTVCIKLLNHDGKESELRLENAALTEYDGETLTIYKPGYRDLTDQERKVLNTGDARRREYQERNPYSDGYWMMKEYFRTSECPWMAGYDFIKSKKYDRCKDKVMDKQVKGEAILKYKVSFA